MQPLPSLDGLIEHMETVQRSRDAVLSESRRIIAACSRTIIRIHQGKDDEAQQMLERVRPQLRALQKQVMPQIRHYAITAEQEYVEALALHSIVSQNAIPSLEEAGVMPESYILGMLDCVGELKRFMLDCIRSDRPEQANYAFDTMEGLYEGLYPFAAYDAVLKESRRKLDVGRITLESSRAIITEENRRRHMTAKICGAGDGI